jgi:hypothetical protein
MSFDSDEQESRRYVGMAVAVAAVAVVVVGAMFLVIRNMDGPDLAVTAAVKATTTTTAPAETPTSTTTSTPPPSMSWTVSETPSLPPPEQPTMTAPVETQAAAPTTTAAPPPPQPTQPQAPNISNVKLTCSKTGDRKVTAKLTFTTTTKVDVTLFAGGQVDHKQAGPGDVSMTTSGRGAEICLARVGDQSVGPIPAT